MIFLVLPRFRSFVFWLALGLTNLPAAAPLRIAILAENNPDLEALLLSKLAKQENLEILSRTELPTLSREAGAFSHSGKLDLKGADRLVVIGQTAEGHSIRVADCATGAVIAEEGLPAKLDVEALSDFLALRLPRQLRSSPKPHVRRVALQGFRFTENTAESRALESRINLACAVALRQSGEAVVLERWRMRDLVFENSLSGDSLSPFWTAASWVDGSVRRAGDRLTVHLEMKNPSGGGKESAVVEGSVVDLSELGRRLAAAILKAQALPAFTAREESQACLHEARWLLDHSLPKEAVQAAESAVALDPSSTEAQVMRIRAYARAAYPDDLSIKFYHGAQGYAGKISPSEVDFSVAMAGEMSRLVGEHVVRHPPRNEESLDDPVCLGMRAMHTSLCVLQAAHDHDYYRKNPEAVETLRVSTERNAGLLRERAKGRFGPGLNIYLVNFAAYWRATPEEAIQEYRSAMRRDFYPSLSQSWPSGIRGSLVETLGRNPPLFDGEPSDRPARGLCRVISWKPEGEAHARTLWESYVSQLAASDDPLEKADGLYFRWGAQGKDANREKALGEILDFLEAHPECLTGPDGRAIFPMLGRPLESLSYVRDASLCRRYIAVLAGLFERDAALPFEVGRRLSQTFGYRTSDDVFRTALPPLVDAMEGHLARSRSSADQPYLGMLTRLHGDLKGLIPPPPKPRTESTLVVKRLWLEQNHATAQGGLDPSSGTWHEGNLWFSEFNRAGYWKIDPDNFNSEFFTGPNPPAIRHCLNGDCRPLFRDGRIFLSSGDDVWSFDLDKKSWQAFGLPRARYILYEANDAIWAIFGTGPFGKPDPSADQGTGLYRIETGNNTAELIFSTRRRPAEHPLDSTTIAAPLGVFSGSDGMPVVGLIGNGKRFLKVKDGTPWTEAVAERLWERVCLKDRALLAQRFNFPRGGRNPPLLESLVAIDAMGRSELLLIDPRLEKAASPPVPGRPVWKIPESLNAYPDVGNRSYCPAMAGETLFLLAGDHVGSTMDFTSTLELYVFERGKSDPARLPLVFEMAEADRAKIVARGENPHRDLNPRPIWHGFLAGDKGLVIACPSGFWFIPMEDVRRAMRRQATLGQMEKSPPGSG